MNALPESHAAVRQSVLAAARDVRLLAVSKTRPATALRALAAQGQRAFGENYVQEALAKQRALVDLDLEWHLIGPLQSNKCREVALHFDWLESLDREKLIAPLDRHRPADRAPLNVLIQVNIDDEDSKSGCAPEDVSALAAAVTAAPRLQLRGLMAIPAPHADPSQRRAAFRRMRALFDALRAEHPDIDTLSMGMSDDFELAIAEGATEVRIGSALFGPRE
ncbi:MAG: YggS family pyridoxal phosphate-dependent enzyme [Xanthomonadaceae bacterium]|nr:YggS family pyridoxal phosphate-dependent enzyme [Xanthomonadaceae bacterium]MDE1959511.1 YggS family pyridoxal phosphate-dependent enzyme [Xanthomonadaceae bacterium]MDE2244895.1 YggS family pyridoxal phosphate-dependent enzyme [Xanthomonadaceae bacterium]